jgi:hypothetical protein
MMAASANGLFASDVRLADLSGDDGVPEIALGRIPVLTSDELLDYLAKVEAQESAGPGSWRQKLLLAADDPDAGGAFTADSETVASLVPDGHSIEKVYLEAMSADAAHDAIVAALEDGVSLFNYIGHGGFDRLADESLLSNPDVAPLGNVGRLPVFLAMTCSVGDFALPGYASLAETMLLQKDGGAVAAWAPSGLSQNDLAVRLDQAFFASAFTAKRPIGDVVVSSLAQLDAPGAVPIRQMYNLLGEPVARLPE